MEIFRIQHKISSRHGFTRYGKFWLYLFIFTLLLGQERASPTSLPKDRRRHALAKQSPNEKVAPIFSKSLPDGGHPLQKAISYPVMLDCLGNRLPNPRWMRSVKIRNIRPRMALSCCRKNGDMPPPHFRNFPVLLEKAIEKNETRNERLRLLFRERKTWSCKGM